jgi:hypothetical protein
LSEKRTYRNSAYCHILNKKPLAQPVTRGIELALPVAPVVVLLLQLPLAWFLWQEATMAVGLFVCLHLAVAFLD